ncbi:hypothetical protein OIU79_005342 [Salix purpurea]|uniref:Uncharacterized protein n=1 Tax=Salix purpurea TaxID=77065 RepID=A0A9Q0ZAM4_SALPP|nr:hypothetical protein OIU79_005342 [Salix purpurea]
MGYFFLVLLLMLTGLSLFASSTPVHDHKPRLLSDSTTSKTDSLKERLGATGTHEHDNSSIRDDSSERSDRVHHGFSFMKVNMVEEQLGQLTLQMAVAMTTEVERLS